MKNIVLNLEDRTGKNLYRQIYELLRDDILDGSLEKGAKLPSLRKLAEGNEISVTTVEAAYEQLLVEGYIESRPKSGYYVADTIQAGVRNAEDPKGTFEPVAGQGADRKVATQERPAIYDSESFDFAKWKKCMNRVFNECEHMLQTEADPQGEPSLRQELASYLYQSRGVKCTADQIVIGAGTQQLTMQLARILKEIGIRDAATETPCYGPIRQILRSEGFPVIEVPVRDNGIEIEKIPTERPLLVYVNPSNQFPSGAVMPVGRRYDLISWAEENGSYILEDDYDAELRYRGKPIPAMQGLKQGGRVIYLGSFSSTLFAAIKISYMVLPEELAELFEKNKSKYGQTCSKAEQLCLAFYMESGYYYRHIKKLRRIYSSKLSVAMNLFAEEGAMIEAIDSQSGLAIMLKVHTDMSAEDVCGIAERSGLTMRPINDLCTADTQLVYFYFYRVPETLLKMLTKQFITRLKGKKNV